MRAATCIGLTLRPDVLARSARRVRRRSVSALIGPLARLAPHAVQEVSQGRCPLLQGPFARVAMDHYRLVEEKFPTLRLVAPNPLAARERGRPAEQGPENVQGLPNPMALVDGPVV